MDSEASVKLFGMSTLLLGSQLDTIEARFDIDLGRHRNEQTDRDEVYYPQFEEAVRREAAAMARHYEIFYCLEKSIRAIISERLEDAIGPKWWDKLPEAVRESAARNMAKERDAGFTLRSSDAIDYVTFGELAVIINANWDVFGDMFSSRRAMEKVMANLNLLRGPIAHCSPLAEDEVIRLQLTLKDWFRLMA